jgi:diaminohydroxyphosphoribosylaminopyrimidine deaminase/5-amino-6-(5-phosphoribosylamino)uracil reductase
VLSNGKIDLNAVLIKLGEMGINNLLVEAGSGLNGAMLEAGLIDEYIIYTAPIILGSDAQSMIQIPLTKMAEKINLDIVDIRNIGEDIKIKAIPR